MQKLPDEVCESILSMEKADLALCAALQESGELARYGYHPRMESLHKENSAKLSAILKTYGFPTLKNSDAGVTAAAWRIVQHSIGAPAFMRGCLRLFARYTYEEIPLKERAYLEDRIAFYERRPQRFGTQFDYTRKGVMAVWWLESREEAEALRRTAGLPSLKEAEEAFRNYPRVSLEEAAQMRKRQEEWLVKTGWCTPRDIERYDLLNGE